MKKTINVGLIGAGMAGQAHALGYRNATMAADLADVTVNLHTVADPNRALAQNVADRYGFASVTGDIDELLQNPDIDVISVALPNFAHASVLSRALACGKHVFAEKPIGRTAQEASDLAGQAAASDAVTGVGFSFRRLPGLAAVANAIADGRIGDVHTVRAWYHADYAADPKGALSWRFSQEQSGGGALLDIGSHAIDAAQYVAGPITRVLSAELRTVITTRPLPAAGAIGHGGSTSTETGPADNDDVALLTVEFANGAIGQVTLSRTVCRTRSASRSSGRAATSGSTRSAPESSICSRRTRADPPTTAPGGDRRPGPPVLHRRGGHARRPGSAPGTPKRCRRNPGVPALRAGCSRMDTNFDTGLAMMNVVAAALQSAKDGTAVTVPSQDEVSLV